MLAYSHKQLRIKQRRPFGFIYAYVLAAGDVIFLFHIIPEAQGAHSAAFTSPSKHQSELQVIGTVVFACCQLAVALLS